MLTWILSLISLYIATLFRGTPPQISAVREIIEIPMFGDPLPNADYTKAIYTTTSYSFDTGWHQSLNLLDMKTKAVNILLKKKAVHEAVWLASHPDLIIYINTTNEAIKGGMGLWILNVSSPHTRYQAASFHHPVSALKVTQEDHRIIFLVEGEEDDNEISAEISGQANVLAYDTLFVRHLDTYVSNKRVVIYSGTLLFHDGKYSQLKGSYDGMMVKGPINTSKYRFSPQAHGQVDLQPGGNLAALILREASLNPANSTSSFIHLMPISGLKESMAQVEKLNKRLSRKNSGAASSPKFSPGGMRLAFLQQDNEINESGRNRLFLYDLGRNKDPMELARLWDMSPHAVSWSSDGKHLWLIAQDRGYSSAFWLPVDATPETLPTKLLTDGSIMSLVPLKNSQVLASTSSFTNPGGFQILDISEDGKITMIDISSKSLAPIIQSIHVEEFNFASDRSTKVHGFLIRPSKLKDGVKYPFVFFIHGGPQDAWLNAWSRNWNPMALTEKEYALQLTNSSKAIAPFVAYFWRRYVVILVNPTGSTGYGQSFTDAVRGEWGGKPYRDIEKAFRFVIKEFDFLDADRAAAIGASFGGYMINWIQGHDLGRRFKALISLNGFFSTTNIFSSDELFYPLDNFNGNIWDNWAAYERFNPARHLRKWSTPHLVLHGDKDYRVPISEGMMTFNVLQSLGIPSRFVVFKDEGHFIIKPRNLETFYAEVLNWLDKWL